MANKVPFVAYFRIVPERGSGKRFEIWRSREKLAHLIWRDLNDILESTPEGTPVGTEADEVANFAAPGGSVTWGLAADEYSLANTMSAVAVKPQFGEFPDTATVVGFYNSETVVPYAEKTLISGGRVVTGPAAGAPGWDPSTDPNAANQAAAKSLKTALESAITSVDAEMIKLEINGVVYGQGGRHFPR